MSRSSEAFLCMEARTEKELGGQLDRDHGQLLSLAAQLFAVDVECVGIDDLSHELEVFVSVLIPMVQESNILLLNAFLYWCRDFDLFITAIAS